MAGCALPLVQAGCLVTLMIGFMSLGYAAGQSVEACPANSPHKALPFLKTAKPETIGALVGTGSTLSINMNAVTDFVKATLVPMIGANVFFFALAALFFVIFILWRFLRFCCYIICCRGSCDAKREKNNVHELLFSTSMKVLKGFMFLFGLVAMVFAIYGMASAGKQKDIVTPAFGVIGTFNDYFGRLSGDVDHLMATISNVTGIIDSFEDVITKDINVDNLTATLTAIGTFLDSDASPPLISNLITTFTNQYNTFTSGASLSAFIAGVAPFQASRDSLQACLTPLSSAQSDIAASGTGMTDVVNSVQTALNDTVSAGVAWADDTVNGGTGPGTTPEMTALNTKLQLMKVGTAGTPTAAGSWWAILDSILTALDCVSADQAPASDPFKVLGSLASSLQVEYNNVATALDHLIAQITKLETENKQTLPTMDYLATRLVYINTSILGLTPDMQNAYDSLTAASTSASQLIATPSPIDSALTSLNTMKSNLAQMALVGSLATNLATASGLLESGPFSGTTKTNYQTWITAVQATLNDASLANFQTAVNAYMGSQTIANWQAISSLHDNAAHGATPTVDNTDYYSPFTTQLNLLLSNSNGVNSPVAVGASSTVQNVATAATNLGIAGNDLTLGTVAAKAAAQSTTTYPMPALGVTAQLNTVNTNYAAFGAPYSTVVSTPKATLTQLKTSAINSGNSAKQQINSSVSTVNSSVAQMKDMLVGKLTKVQKDYEPLAKKYDGYRYDASMALYGISILFVCLLLLSACLNYHFGANLSTFLLLIITVLYFLLAVVIALLISVLYLGCGDLEHLILQFAPQLSPKFAPVISYYFGTDKTQTLKTVLKGANLTDIDALMIQIESSQGNIVSSLSSTYTLKSVPLAVLGRINGTISGIDVGVNTLLTTLGRDGLMPVYTDVKGLVCCLVPDFMSSMWIGLTFAGIFAFALIFCTFFYIGKLDKTPRKDCCGCTCHTAAKYDGTVFPDTLPQFQAPGFENPMGPYDAPNGAYLGEPTVVVNAPHDGVRKAV